MKKRRFLSMMLCLCMLLQSGLFPLVQATGVETSPEDTLTQPVEIPFGQVCVQKGCRTINGMVPLGGSDYMLEPSLCATARVWCWKNVKWTKKLS